MKFSAVIFDLDGTILNNEIAYAQSFRAVFKKHNTILIDGDYPHTPGIGMKENWDALKKNYAELKDATTIQLMHETQSEYHERIKDVDVRPGFFELIELLKSVNIDIALATSNNWWLVEDELEDLNLKHYFKVITTVDEVYEPKPNPEIFLLTARKLHTDPADCIVIEDSAAGMLSGKSAGMKVIGIRNAYNEEDEAIANIMIDEFYELNLMKLESLFK